MKNRKNLWRQAGSLALAGILSLGMTCSAWAATSIEQGVLKYEELEEVVSTYNPTVKNQTDGHYTDIADYQTMADDLRFARQDQLALAEQYKENGNTEAAAIAKSNAASLSKSAKQMDDRIEALTSWSGSSSVRSVVNTQVKNMQTLLINYSKTKANQELQAKNVEMMQAKYESAVTKSTSGLATEADVLTAQKNLEAARNNLTSTNNSLESQKEKLCQLVGMASDSALEIGGIPEADVTFASSIDTAADIEKAVNNDSSVISARHTSAKGTAAKNTRATSEANAEAAARTSYEETYQALLQAQTQYQAANEAYQSALLTYQSLQRQQNLGMIGRLEYLQGEVTYLQSKSSWESAKLSFRQAQEDYQWMVTAQ